MGRHVHPTARRGRVALPRRLLEGSLAWDASVACVLRLSIEGGPQGRHANIHRSLWLARQAHRISHELCAPDDVVASETGAAVMVVRSVGALVLATQKLLAAHARFTTGTETLMLGGLKTLQSDQCVCAYV